MMKKYNMEALQFINNYWVILVFIGGFIGNWYMIRNQMRLFELRLKHLEHNSDSRNEKDAETRAKLMVIENMLSNMTKNMEDLKNDLRRLAEKGHEEK